MAQTYMGSKGRTMSGGNPASPQVKLGQQLQTQSAIASEYARRGGGFEAGPGGTFSGKPLDSSLFRESTREALGRLGNRETGYGGRGWGRAERMEVEDDFAEARRRDEQDRDELEKNYGEAAENRALNKEMRTEQRSVLAEARKRMGGGGGGGGGGGSYKITGL